jgi:hypothetical protein
MVDGLWIEITSTECWSDFDMSELCIYPRSNVTAMASEKFGDYRLRNGHVEVTPSAAFASSNASKATVKSMHFSAQLCTVSFEKTQNTSR